MVGRKSFYHGVSELPQKRKETTMNFIGIDLHKRIIVICVMNDKREIVARKKFSNDQVKEMREFFESQKPFQAVFEATAAYDWFYGLLEPLAEKVVLAHPKKLRIIAESTKKSDKVDAYILANFLALDMIPEAHCPSPYIKGYRNLVRLRCKIQGRITSAKVRMRNVLAKYNRDRLDLFTKEGREWLAKTSLGETDRFKIDLLMEELSMYESQLDRIEKKIREYARKAPIRIAEAREILRTIPGVGEVTADVVVSELGDVDRFASQKKVCSYAGLTPGRRQSAEKETNLPITKEGSKLLRWVLVEAAWCAVQYSQKWKRIYESMLERTSNKKKAIVAVARKLLCVMTALLRRGCKYSVTA